MSNTSVCADCGNAVPAEQPKGLCPHCALGNPAAHGARPPGAARSMAGREILGEYELLEEIARGGMGIVCKARQKSLQRIVAVKLLLPGARADTDFIKRFRIEGSAAAALIHPNIVAVHQVGVFEGEHFLVMDYVDGPNLAKLVRDQPLPSKRAAQLVRTIANAIHYAHGRGILHRDIKPSNVLIDGDDHPRVTDFGLAKRFEADSPSQGSEHSRLTLSGHVLGSPGYMSPEQASGKRDKLGRQSDVYSLGATLYHLLTGRPPFVGESIAQTLRHVEESQPLAPRTLNPAVPRDLETICLKCLEKDPQRRYTTAMELADDLDRHLSHKPILARPTGAILRTIRWAGRNPAAAGLIAALVLALGVLVGLLKVLNDRRQADFEAAASIRAMVVSKIEEMWQRPDKMSERISAEQLAALSGKRKSPAPPGTLRLKVGLGATESPERRATQYQPMLDFLEHRMEAILHRPVRLDMVLSKDVRLDKFVAQDSVDLVRIGALAFIRARETNPRLVPLAQENARKDAVLFVLGNSGITNLAQVHSIAFADTNSTISTWAKVYLVRSGIYATSLTEYANLPTRINDMYAHQEAVRAVVEHRFDAGIARPSQLASEVGVEGKDWRALLKFDSSQTLWVTGGAISAEVRNAFKASLLELSGLQHLEVPDRVRSLIPIEKKELYELEQILERDLKRFDNPNWPERLTP